MMIYGMPIFFTSMALETTAIPVREYRRRRWQSIPQFTRKQKKWIKRFGYKKQPCMWQTPQGIFAHPSFEPRLRAAISGKREGEG